MSLSDHDASRLRAAVAGCPDTFDVRFEILRDAGAGGMGRVYEAIDHGTGRRVAIKVVERVADQARFVAEAEILEKLDHDAIVSYVRHGATAAGDPYLVMAWLVGETLSARLADKGALAIVEAVALGERIAGALVHAHAAGVVHRDLKPSNVLLVDGQPERAMLIDFGVAKTARDLTHTGQLVGTPGYMAPEQVRGEKSLDGRVDLFALGCVLYEALACRAPFEGAEVMEILARLLLEEPRPITELVPAVTPRLGALIGALLAKEPSQRVADAVTVRDELAAIRAAIDAGDVAALTEPGPGVPRRRLLENAPTVAERPARRRPPRIAWIAPIALIAFVPILIVILVVTHEPREDPAEQPRSPPPEAPSLPCTKNVSKGCAARCRAGDAEACFHDATATYHGRDGRTADRAGGIATLGRSCELGYDAACASAGGKLFDAVKDRERPAADAYPLAERLLALGCQRGSATACRRLGAEYLPGGKLATDVDRGLELLGKGCDNYELASCIQLRNGLESGGGSPAVRERAAATLREACRKNPRLNCKP